MKLTLLCVRAEWAVLGSTDIVLQTDSNFPSKGQFFISIFTNVYKLEKVGVTPFKMKKSMMFLIKWLQKFIDLNHNNFFLIYKKPLCIILDTSLCKDIKRKLKCISLNDVLPSDTTLVILRLWYLALYNCRTHNWLCVPQYKVNVYSTWYI